MVAKAGYYDTPDEYRNWESPNHITGPNVGDDEPHDLVGIIEWHPKQNPAVPADNVCGGGVYFVPNVHRSGNPVWSVESLDPLTISPSVLCGCGSHGFIKDGKWIEA